MDGRQTVTKVRVFLGAAMITIPLCLSMVYGNVATYMYSLFYSKLQLSSFALDAAWMNGICFTAFAVGTLVMDLIRFRIGLRFTTALGIFLCSSGLLLTFFSVQHSVWTTCITYIVMGGLGDGIVAPATVLFVTGWFEKSVGLALAIIGATSGIGGFFFNYIITTYINPKNLSPDIVFGEMSYFSQSQVVDRVPSSFLIVGSIMACLQVIGFCLLKEPPVKTREDKANAQQGEYGADGRNQNGELSYQLTSMDHPSEGKYDTAENGVTSDTCMRLDNNTDKTAKQVLKTEVFYNVWFSSFAEALVLLIATTYYKIFGEMWIQDDKLFAFTGGVSSLLTVIFRPLCGHLFDIYGVKYTLMIHMSLSSIFISVWYFTPKYKWWYFVWTNIILSFINNMFIMYPIATLKLFGSRHFASNLFLIQTSVVIVMLALPSLLTFLLNTWGWFWLFTFGNVAAFVSFLLIVIRM